MTAELASDLGTAGAGSRTERIPGCVSSAQLRESPVYFFNGPTGRSLLWPEQLSTLMYECATTDPGFNRVDAVWMHDGRTILIELVDATPYEQVEIISPVRELVRELRGQLGMSVDDVAAMCGVGRRQLYNLMSGHSTVTGQEAHIRRLADQVDQLFVAVGGSPQRVRSIALHPVEGSTFFDAARAQDTEQMNTLTRRLVRAVDNGQLSGVIRRPSPRRRAQARPGALAELFGEDDGV